MYRNLMLLRCISYYSYIKPQLLLLVAVFIPSCISYYSYIKPQLYPPLKRHTNGCISYYSYIKPQLTPSIFANCDVVYRTIPTSNHNTAGLSLSPLPVVYRTIPTSNHNGVLWRRYCMDVVYRTIPTSNHNHEVFSLYLDGLYIVLFLHQTTTVVSTSENSVRCISYYSYIKPQLGQNFGKWSVSCISYYSYIKPQRSPTPKRLQCVVYRTIPTSNHNWISLAIFTATLYIVLFLHQTTTYNGDIADNQHVTITFINKK